MTKYQRLTDPFLLKQIGRPLLERFLMRFEPSLAGQAVLLPPPGALDQEFFNLVAHLMMSPDGLPDDMKEAIHTIYEMSTPEGRQRIEQLIEQTGAPVEFQEESTPQDIALQLWLSAPELLNRARTLHRLSRLSSFHHFGRKGSGPVLLRAMDAASIAGLEGRCDRWFARHGRGCHNTRIELYHCPSGGGCIEGAEEHWFVIRHGDTFVRTPKIDRGRTEVLHFRPARDDVAVFNPSRCELRINARTIGERDLYRAAFGEHLFGDADAFSERKKYTLQPLIDEGEDALDTRTTPGLVRATLRGLEIALEGTGAPRIVCKAGDLFRLVRDGILPTVAPAGSELTQAWFDLYFEGADAPRAAHLRPPNTLRLSSGIDTALVDHWFRSCGFCTLNHEAQRPASLAGQTE